MKVYDWNAICQAFAPLYNSGKTVNEAYETLKESGYDLPHPCTFRVRIRQACRARNIDVEVRSHRSQPTTLPPVYLYRKRSGLLCGKCQTSGRSTKAAAF